MPCAIRLQYSGGNLTFDQEDFLKYASGGFHPVSLGDTLSAGRYTVYHKLGFGSFATVWLAKDKQTNRWVAVKILTANHSRLSQEHQTLLALAECAKNDNNSLEALFIIQLLDQFTHQGSNGSHLCLVFALLGPSVHNVVDSCRMAAQYDGVEYHEFLEPPTILKMSRQLLKAVAFVHKSGYAHGDISARNIAFTATHASRLAQEDFLKIVGTPKTEVLTRRDGEPLGRGLPTQLVEAAKWLKWMDEAKEDIRLIDFGGGFLCKGPQPDKLCQPAEFRAPEALMTGEFDWRVDLWSVGIMVYFLVFGRPPFYSGGGPASLVAQMINFVEDLPPEWRSNWERLKSGENSSLNIRPNNGSKSYLEQEFDKKVRARCLKPLLGVIQSLVRFRPSDRISAAKALEMIAPDAGRVNLGRWVARRPNE